MGAGMSPQRLRGDARSLYDKYMQKRGIRIGSTLHALYAKGGTPLIQWIADNTPAGVTVSEVLASMAMDEMLDDTQPIAEVEAERDTVYREGFYDGCNHMKEDYKAGAKLAMLKEKNDD